MFICRAMMHQIGLVFNINDVAFICEMIVGIGL